jgi:hypothetical protein
MSRPSRSINKKSWSWVNTGYRHKQFRPYGSAKWTKVIEEIDTRMDLFLKFQKKKLNERRIHTWIHTSVDLEHGFLQERNWLRNHIADQGCMPMKMMNLPQGQPGHYQTTRSRSRCRQVKRNPWIRKQFGSGYISQLGIQWANHDQDMHLRCAQSKEN